MPDNEELEPQHDLTYKAKVEPPPGYLMGPDTEGRLWKVLGSMYNAEHDTTLVTVERVGLS